LSPIRDSFSATPPLFRSTSNHLLRILTQHHKEASEWRSKLILEKPQNISIFMSLDDDIKKVFVEQLLSDNS
ncbi:unnamed protein product, partial [Prunus brigantina]